MSILSKPYFHPTAARGWAPEARFFRARAGREAGTSEPHLRL